MLGGQIESLYTAPRFKAKDAAGAAVGERQWAQGEALGHDGAIAYLADFLRQHLGEHRLAAVGHRVVHGGVDYAAPVRLTAEIVKDLEKFIPLAPLHQPHNLTPIRLLLANQPQLPQVACFDTAFHRHQPEVAQAFALPPEITERGVRRYGFHGLSYEYIASVLPQFDSRTLRRDARWCCIWATVPVFAPSREERAYPAPWASPPSTDCRWARAAAIWIPASFSI